MKMKRFMSLLICLVMVSSFLVPAGAAYEKAAGDNGVWSVPVKMMHASKANTESMGNAAVDGNATVTIDGNKATYVVNFKGIVFSGLYGHLLKLWHYPDYEANNDSETGVVPAAGSNRYEDKNLQGGQDYFFKTFTMNRNFGKENEYFIRISVDAMAGFDQDAKLVYDWSKAKKVSSPEPENKIEDGNYYVGVSLYKEAKDEPSMGTMAFKNNGKALVTIKNDKVTTVQIGTNPVQMGTIKSGIIDMGIDGKAVTKVDTMKLTTVPAGNTYDYIRTLKFEMPKCGQPAELKGITYVPVTFTVPDTPMDVVVVGGLKARLRFVWDNAKKTNDVKLVGNTTVGADSEPVELKDKATGIEINTNTIIFDKKSALSVTKPTTGNDYETAKKAMTSVSEKWDLYKIVVTVNGKETAPKGQAPVAIPCEAEGLKVYRVNGGVKVPVTGKVENGYYKFNTSQLGLFAIVGETEEKPEPEQGQFTDVPANFWGKPYIDFAVEHGIFNGITPTEFKPNDAMNRAMFITVLGRLAGVDKNASGETKFSDVPADQYYAPYVAWGVKNGIVSGTSETTFAPNAKVSRQDMSVFLARYCKYANINLKNNGEKEFTDEAMIQPYAKEAVHKIVSAGLLNGMGDGMFSPATSATRAQVATLLTRFVKEYVK